MIEKGTAAVTTRITTTDNGPLLLDGAIDLTDFDGTSVQVPEHDTVALCRCGQSKNKPFCDGSHSASGFDGTLNPGNRVV
jgi:CDGSH-type Zn-finger protein